ncbi:MAG: TRAM domain-containing protein [Clostridiales bacterium]|nr:TRAM domain-containing protein [Clostridiales bacterium]
MMNRVIKFSFAAVGAVTGITLTRIFLEPKLTDTSLITVFYLVAAIFAGLLFYFSGLKIINIVMDFFDQVELRLQSMTLYELAMSAAGLIIGLIIANLVTIPINKVEIVGTPIAVFVNILFGSLGIALALVKKNESIADAFKGRMTGGKGAHSNARPKVFDTSVIIDGRIVDICRSGFVDGELVVPSFVLEELRHIADSQDAIKRNRGRRGLDVLNTLQKELQLDIRIENVEISPDAEVDNELLKLTEKLGGKVLTIDYNLSKVAVFQKVPVLNINDLANALKPIALPGEDMIVQVIKDGKENGQGIGYLEDGTMIVIDGGRRHIGESLNVTVTSTLQTAAGRMVFAKPKYTIERVI